jgi:hypothetical protein
MDFPHAGDLMVISTVYPDGTVAALEELIGNHGGMGGEQTDAFIFHPPAVQVPDTRNSTDVFHILNDRRGASVQPAPPTPVHPDEEDWSPRAMVAGIRRVPEWSSALLGCLTFAQGAYERVAADPAMTGPAHVIALVMVAVASVSRQGEFSLTAILTAYAAWWLATIIVYGAGYLVTRKGTYPRTFRALGFAQVVLVVEVLALFGPIARGVHFVALAALFVAMWMGAAAAHETRGWRTLLLPVAAIAVAVLGAAVLHLLIQGTIPALDALATEVGLAR